MKFLQLMLHFFFKNVIISFFLINILYGSFSSLALLKNCLHKSWHGNISQFLYCPSISLKIFVQPFVNFSLSFRWILGGRCGWWSLMDFHVDCFFLNQFSFVQKKIICPFLRAIRWWDISPGKLFLGLFSVPESATGLLPLALGAPLILVLHPVHLPALLILTACAPVRRQRRPMAHGWCTVSHNGSLVHITPHVNVHVVLHSCDGVCVCGGGIGGI